MKWMRSKYLPFICYLELLQSNPWRTNSLFFSFLKLKSSELLNMRAAIKNMTSGSQWHCLSYIIPSPPCPHFILNHRKNTSQPGQVFNVSIDRALQDQSEGSCWNLSTFFLPLGISPNVPLLFCSSSKNSRWLYRCCLWKCSLCT